MPNTAIDLAHTMKQNPNMRVLVQQGYYEAGHMMYVHEPSMKKFKEDLARFVQEGGKH
jgi:carboxypeptidase C (cathepsin A)